MKERREWIRLSTDVNIKWTPVDTEGGLCEYNDQESKNIGTGGICMLVDEPVESGDCVYLEIELPNARVIRAKGMVIWKSEFEVIGGQQENKQEIGVKFYDLAEDDRHELERFVFSKVKKGS
ncbi:MAG: hypothetical protein GF333_07805 [Candidatus Omnitrophica bacterium]|nr:hypothetical protein [Candidatus Omnitrophota bacterium]